MQWQTFGRFDVGFHFQGPKDDRPKAFGKRRPHSRDRCQLIGASGRSLGEIPQDLGFNQRSAPWCLTVGEEAQQPAIPSGSDPVEPTVRVLPPAAAATGTTFESFPEIAEQGGSTTSRPFGIGLDGGDSFCRLLPTGQHWSPVHRTFLRVELAGEPVGGRQNVGRNAASPILFVPDPLQQLLWWKGDLELAAMEQRIIATGE
jgi:hypothetical protein